MARQKDGICPKEEKLTIPKDFVAFFKSGDKNKHCFFF